MPRATNSPLCSRCFFKHITSGTPLVSAKRVVILFLSRSDINFRCDLQSQTPADAWQTGLNRTLEILVGAICSLVVTTLVWPRYARAEFLETGRAATENGKPTRLGRDADLLTRDRSAGRTDPSGLWPTAVSTQ